MTVDSFSAHLDEITGEKAAATAGATATAGITAGVAAGFTAGTTVGIDALRQEVAALRGVVHRLCSGMAPSEVFETGAPAQPPTQTPAQKPAQLPTQTPAQKTVHTPAQIPAQTPEHMQATGLLDLVGCGACLVDSAGGVLAANGELLAHLGVSDAQWISADILGRFPGCHANLWMERAAACCHDCAEQSLTLRLGERDYRCVMRPVPAGAGGCCAFVTVIEATGCLDSEELLRATARLHAALSEASTAQLGRATALFDKVFAEVPVGIALLSHDGHILQVNRTLAMQSGWTEEELAGREIAPLVHEDDREFADRFFAPQDTPAQARDGSAEHAQIRFLDKSGNVHDCELSLATVRDEHDVPFLNIVVVNDVTTMQRMHEETARMGQLAALGELAAGVAHEINSPVNAIINCADLIMDDAEGLPDICDMARRIREEGRRVAAITHNLLSFAGDRKRQAEHVDVAIVLTDALMLSVAQLRGEGIAVDVAIVPGLPPVLVSWRELQQVFLNLISNARYALNAASRNNPAPPRLLIRMHEVERQGVHLVRIVFEDNGTGVPPSLQGKVFEPFFTTKPEGRGTGLGLSICRSITERFGGRLTLESDGESGSSITVELPVALQAGAV